MTTLGVGVIGMGWMGTAHGRAYHAVSDRFSDKGIRARLVICADDVEARAHDAQQRLGFEQCTTNWREVIEHPEVQAVNVASPNFLHKEMALAAVDAGKHLFCEKPVGRTPEETTEIYHAVKRAGLMSFVGLNYRWAPLVQYARQLIVEGKLGQITSYHGRFFIMYASNPLGQLSWRFLKEKAGTGALGDIMAHAVDMAHYLVGSIEQVTSTKKTFINERPLPVPGRGTHFSIGSQDDPKGEVTNEDYVGAMVRFGNGARGTLEVNRIVYGPKCEMAFEVYGTRGAVKWNFETMNEIQLYLPDETGGHEGFVRILAGPEHPFHARFNPGPGVGLGYDDLKTIEAYHFLQSIVDHREGAPSLSDAYAFANVHKAMMRSWDSRSWETIEPL